MGKRSNFKRNPRDFYETWDENAVIPLLPHLPRSFTYDDPCYGTGYIPTHLKKLLPNSSLHSYFDISPRDYYSCADYADATTHKYQKFADYFITNPPWTPTILHKIIENLASQKPTWLLFYADWFHTKQASPYLDYCHKIVSVGRVKWIKDSKYSGKDNCCWYLFDKSFEGQTQLIGRAA